MNSFQRFSQYYASKGLPIVGWAYIIIGLLTLVALFTLRFTLDTPRILLFMVIAPFMFPMTLFGTVFANINDALSPIDALLPAVIWGATGWGLLKKSRLALGVALILLIIAIVTVGFLFIGD